MGVAFSGGVVMLAPNQKRSGLMTARGVAPNKSSLKLPAIAASILKGVISSLANAGLITRHDGAIMGLLGLGISFIDRDASREIDRLTVENERMRAETRGGLRHE